MSLKCHSDWWEVSAMHISSEGREEFSGHHNKPVSFMLLPRKVTEQILPEDISRHIQDKKMNRNGQHEFRMSLTKSNAFYNEMMG